MAEILTASQIKPKKDYLAVSNVQTDLIAKTKH